MLLMHTLRLLVKSRFFWYGAAILAVWLYSFYQYNKGYDRRESEYQKLILEERSRVESANRIALEQAMTEVRRLRESARVRDAHLERILKEAEADSRASHDALSPDSVRRINSVR